MKFNLEDLYLNIKQCILILMKNYTIWSHNLVLLLLKKRTLFSKIGAVSAHESKSGSCSSELSLQALVCSLNSNLGRTLPKTVDYMGHFTASLPPLGAGLLYRPYLRLKTKRKLE